MAKVVKKGLFSSPLFKQAPVKKDWKAEYAKIVQLFQQGQLNQALKQALDLYQAFPLIKEVQNLTATLLASANREQEAIEIWEKIADKNQDAVILNNIANARMELGLLDEKTEHYFAQALTIHPNYSEALFNYGILKHRTYKNDEALQIYQKLVALQQYDRGTMTNLLFSLYYSYPLPLSKIKECLQLFAKTLTTNTHIQAATPPKKSDSDKALRIGIVCADLRMHPVGYFFESLISAKASRQFSWIVYANTEKHDAVSQRLEQYCEDWYKNVQNLSDEQLINLIRHDEIDILLDLTGYSGEHRLSVYATQTAPIQISWLGYWGTTALPTVQAVIADPYCVHDGEEKWFTEKVYRMPHTRLCMMPPTAPVAVNTLPALKNGYTTFACFQNLLKVNDHVLTLWSKIAQQLPQAKWIFQNADLSPEKHEYHVFYQRLKKFGFRDEQFSLHGKADYEAYLKSYHQIDYILDVFPYTGGTTTTEALWMGVPTITLSEEGMIARQGEQLLSVAGLADWVCTTEQAYIDKVVYWANPENYQRLNALRLGLREQVLASPLFDTEQFAEDWCALVRQIWVDECNK